MKRSSDRKSILSLIGGSAASQAISFLFAPVLTRLFKPEVFGDLAVFTSITGIIGIIACLRYEMAIVLPEDDAAGYGLLRLSWFFAAGIAAITALVFLSFGPRIFTAFGAVRLSTLWFYVPITIVLGGWSQASMLWLTRRARFGALAMTKVLPVITLNAISVGLGVIGYRELGARLFAALAGSLTSVAILAWTLRGDLPKSTEKRPSAIQLLKEYKNSLIYDVWAALTNNISWMLVPILVNYYYGSYAAGQYSIGLRVIQIPISIIGASISQVFLKSANDRRDKGELHKYSLETARRLFLYTAPFAVALAFLGRPLFVMVFGPEWETAGVYAQILAPWALVWFVGSPLSAIYNVLQIQRTILVLTMLNLATRFLSLYVGALYHSDKTGLYLFSVSGCLVYGLVLGVALVSARRHDRLIAQKG